MKTKAKKVRYVEMSSSSESDSSSSEEDIVYVRKRTAKKKKKKPVRVKDYLEPEPVEDEPVQMENLYSFV